MPDDALEAMPERSTERHPGLETVVVYTRVVEAPIAAVWENVLDWEHLPWLHSQAFTSIEPRAFGAWGWHADVGLLGGVLAEIELVIDHERSCYVARTRAGAGAPGEIWTQLEATGEEETAIRVEFCMPPMPEAAQAKVGAVYRELYSGLWDQDEEMMQARVEAMTARGDRASAADATPSEAALELGDWSVLRARLPVTVDFGGNRFRIALSDGAPVVHSAQCPHWLGPLDECAIEGGIVTCPWHGYRFDATSGRSVDERGLRLRPAPRLEIDDSAGIARLVPAG